ncbi:MAG: DUF933 domain-containing protein [Pirellulales bacterium]
MKIGLVGYQGAGKSTLFEWLTGVRPDPALAHTQQAAATPVPEPRVAALCEVYHPKKITLASLDLVDTPGLSRTHEGNPARLGHIREAGCLVLVTSAVARPDPLADLASFEEDLLLADMEIVGGRLERLRDSLRKPRPNRDQEQAELTALEPILAAMEGGKPMRTSDMNDAQVKATRSFRLLSEKPRMIVVNVDDDEAKPERFEEKSTPDCPVVAVPLRLQLELAQMEAAERAALVEEMGLKVYDRDSLLRTIMGASGQMLYFTAGEKEVRTWMIHKGGTALEAADNIHSDLARGFIRAEVMTCADLIRLGSEREIKANNLVRQEPKDYVVRDGDILNIKFSV